LVVIVLARILLVANVDSGFDFLLEQERKNHTQMYVSIDGWEHDNSSLRILIEQLLEPVNQRMFVLLCLTLELVSYFEFVYFLKD
jgi:hypothetical protein